MSSHIQAGIALATETLSVQLGEREVLRLVSSGHTSAEIGTKLEISAMMS